MKTEWMDCKCGTASHAVRFTLARHSYPEDPEIYVEPVVADRPSFWYRLKLAFKYVLFSEAPGVGEVLLNEDSVNRLSKLLVTYRLLLKVRAAKRQEALKARKRKVNPTGDGARLEPG